MPCRSTASGTRRQKNEPLSAADGIGASRARDRMSEPPEPTVIAERMTALPIRSGMLSVRLAESMAEIDAAQALRFRVFYEEMGATPTPEMARQRRDFDPFDEVADHLLVIDDARGPGAQAVIGTYRLVRRDAAQRAGRFYSAAEYDISDILTYGGEVLELGRSCVDASARNRPTMQLLW